MNFAEFLSKFAPDVTKSARPVKGGVLYIETPSSPPPKDGGVRPAVPPRQSRPVAIDRASLRVVDHPFGCALADCAGYIDANRLTAKDAHDIVLALKGETK